MAGNKKWYEATIIPVDDSAREFMSTCYTSRYGAEIPGCIVVHVAALNALLAGHSAAKALGVQLEQTCFTGTELTGNAVYENPYKLIRKERGRVRIAIVCKEPDDDADVTAVAQ